VWVDGNVGLAHQRLSVIDLSVAGHQPLTSANGRFVLAYNGEIYNFQQIKNDLEGVFWKGTSDTEVLAEAISAWGIPRTLERLVGMFAFAVCDREQKTLTLVRDRLGIKPLYYGRAGRDLYFASELSALPSESMSIDRDALALLLKRNHIPAPWTIFKGVRKLLPGSMVTFDTTRIVDPDPQIYWQPGDYVAEAEVDYVSARSRVHELMETAVRDRMIADVPLGGFLSGGVDSSLVCALMQKASMAPVKTFTIGFEEQAFNEAPYAAEVAAHLGTDHVELMVGEHDVLGLVESLGEMLDEPFADASLLPTSLVSRLTRQSVTVALSGDGGDELFVGYQRYQWAQQVSNWLFSLPAGLRSALARGASSPGLQQMLGHLPSPGFLGRPAPLGAKLARAADFLGVRDTDELFAQTVTHWAQPENVVLNAQVPATVYDDRDHFSSVLTTPRRWAAKDLVGYLPNDCLTKIDRASMRASLEARVPLLDHRLVEYVLGLPGSVLCPEGVPKGIVKDILGDYVPQSMIDRPKRGFAVPLGTWLKGPLRTWASDHLAETRLRHEGYFDFDVVSRTWQAHLKGEGDWSAYLWDILMFQVWLDARHS
jgi:asparagine synthase (glutamine-hydrolysing)